MQPENEARYEGVHCHLLLQRFPRAVVVLRITGTDGASIAISGDWAVWLGANQASLRSVTMLTGSRFIQVTAEFVRRFSALEGIMRICTEPPVFDSALAEAMEG